MYKGIIIKESLDNLDILNKVHITKEESWDVENAAPDQSKVWSVAYFEVPESSADILATEFSKMIKAGTWFIDFENDKKKYVVFRNKIFTYTPDDTVGKGAVKMYARSIGIPESQLNW